MAYAEALGCNALVLTKPTSIGQWCGEINKFAASSWTRVDGTPKKRVKAWKEAIENNSHYIVTSYDILKDITINKRKKIKRESVDFPYAAEYLGNNGIFILDEIGKVKNRDSERFKAIASLRPYAKVCVGLTATPIENNLAEFYNILSLICPEYMPSYETFEEQYLIRRLYTPPNYKHPHWKPKSIWLIVGEKNVDKFKDIIKPIFIRYEQDEVQNLPPSSTVIREVELSPEQKKIEKILLEIARRDPTTLLTNFSFALENVLDSSIVDMEKVTCDIDTKEELINLGSTEKLSPRLLELQDLLDELQGEQVVIYSRSVKALKLIRDHVLKDPYSMVIGELSNAERDEEISRFQKKVTRIMLLSAAGEEALNLQNARHLIIFSKPWNFSRLIQLRGRIRRTGQQFPTIYYEFKSNSIVEERLEGVLQDKRELADMVLAKEVMR